MMHTISTCYASSEVLLVVQKSAGTTSVRPTRVLVAFLMEVVGEDSRPTEEHSYINTVW